MTVEVYLVGIDLIIDNENKIKILELQNIYESNTERANELTNLDPVAKLKQVVKKAYPDFSMAEPEPGKTQEYAKRVSKIPSASAAEEKSPKKTIIINRGIEAKTHMKWLFYATCNQLPKLRRYIPRTIIATLNTVDDVFRVEELKDQRFIFKPADQACGYGITLLPQSLDSQDKLGQCLEDACRRAELPEIFFRNRPFLIQEYLFDGTVNNPKSKPVIRLYAAIVWDKSKDKLRISIDTNAAYQHVRIQQSENDFTLDNNTHEKCDVDPAIQLQIHNFLKEFFGLTLSSQSTITHRYWMILAKKYIQSRNHLSDKERFIILSQFAMALLQEQRFTENRLSHYQCFLLERFIECYKEKDAQLFFAKGITGYILNSFSMVAKCNLEPYKTDMHYPLHAVFKAYEKLILTKIPSAQIGEQFKTNMALVNKNAKSIKPYSMTRGISFFDYLTHEDIDSVSATSTKCLSLVARYAAAFEN